MKVSVRNKNEGKTFSDGRRKPPNWEWRFYGAVVDGKRTYYSGTGFKTKKEAQAAGVNALQEYTNTGAVFRSNDISVADYLQLWLDTYGKANLKDTTIEGYSKLIKNHIVPEIGNYYLKDLDSQRLQELIWNFFNKGYSRNRVSELKGILSSSMAYAVEPAHLIKQDPMVYVKMPSSRVLAKTPTRTKERRPVTDEEWDKIMQRFPEGHPAHIPLVIAYRCGLRIGEVFALMWEDIDFLEGTMTIDRQIQYNNTRKVWEFTAPKYESYRTITVDPDTLALLKREYDRQQRAIPYYADLYRQAYAADVRPSQHLCDSGYISAEGIPVHMVMSRDCGDIIHSRIMQHVGRVIHGHEATECISKDWDFHSLRHTHASRLIEAGVPIQMVQERLGHATIKMTGRYTHATEGMRSALADTLKELY